MKKKPLFIVISVILLAVIISGTIAYFSMEFSSDENTATAATFDVDVVNADGETIGDAQFDLDEKLYPGMETREVYTFDINKNNTEVPLEYSVNLTPSGDLFPSDGSTPIELKMERLIDGNWTTVDHSTQFRPENDTESYRILIDWPHGDNDIEFQGTTGNISLEVVATQVDDFVIDLELGNVEFINSTPIRSGSVVFEIINNGSQLEGTSVRIDRRVQNDWVRVITINNSTIQEGSREYSAPRLNDLGRYYRITIEYEGDVILQEEVWG